MPLFSKGDPDPEPGDHLNEDEGEEEAVLQAVAAPAGCAIGGAVKRNAAATDRGSIDGRRWTEEIGIED